MQWQKYVSHSNECNSLARRGYIGRVPTATGINNARSGTCANSYFTVIVKLVSNTGNPGGPKNAEYFIFLLTSLKFVWVERYCA